MPAAFEQRLVEAEDVRIGMKRAATLILVAAGADRERQRRMHVDRAVALPGETVAEPEEGPFRGADQPRKGLDLGRRHAADGFRPFRRPVLEM
jgi:hypothetical protein